jgi:RimJ/RimL family protein N-acetyltransferase
MTITMYHSCMAHRSPIDITLRPTTESDLRLIHSFELDPRANELAGTKPRDWPTFAARWAVILADKDGTATGVTPRVILADGVPVGSVNLSPYEGPESIGYWIGREHWGRGIATRAVEVMLRECPQRPIFATASASNHASLRVLEKNGFVEVSRCVTPATERAVERETVTLVLRCMGRGHAVGAGTRRQHAREHEGDR